MSAKEKMEKKWWWMPVLPLLGFLLCLPFFWWIAESTKVELIKTQEASLQRQAETIAVAVAGILADDEGGDTGNTYRSLPVSTPVSLDGRQDDWPEHEPLKLGLDHLLEIYQPYATGSLTYELSIANDADYLYLFYRVMDDFVIYRQVNHLSVHRNDHIQIAVDKERFQRYTLAVQQPGEVTAMEVGYNGRALREEPLISGWWLATEQGYNVELRIPRKLLSRRISTLVSDVDDSSRAVKYLMGLTHTGEHSTLGRLIYSPTILESLLLQVPVEAEVLDNNGQRLAINNIETVDPFIEVSVPVGSAVSGGSRRAGLVVREPINLAPLSRVSARMVTFAILVGLILSLAAIGILGLMRRERSIQAAVTDKNSRLAQQNEYLERMASRLNHELRTPVSVVRSSLENQLAEVTLPGEQVYVERALQGVTRLTNILNKMSEARRLEESLVQEEIERFDLVALTTSCIAGYESAFPQMHFELSVEVDAVPVTGIPEMFAQMLDKLIDNAVEFSSSNTVRVRLHVEGEQAYLRVLNEGPTLPTLSTGQVDELFESMVSVRGSVEPASTGGAEQTHLGLGLYVARQIAVFHGADLTLANREDARGVIATVALPVLRITSKLSGHAASDPAG